MASVRPVGHIEIGPYALGDDVPARCVVTVKPKSDSKIDKKEADGKSGAVTTWKGAKPSEWDVEITWNGNDPDADDAIEEILYQLSPVGPNPGKPWQFTAKRARIHGTDNVIVENVDGPNDKPGSGDVSAKIKLTSWKPPKATAAGQGTATTGTDPAKWTGGDPHQVTPPHTTVTGFGGDPNNQVTFPGNVPTAKP